MPVSSPISVYQPGLVRFADNYAEIAGGGLYLEIEHFQVSRKKLAI